MNNVILITAKGGNQSIQDKHFFPILGKPLLYYPIQACLESKLAKRVFLTTEDSKIKDFATGNGVNVLDRPSELAQPLTNHGDVIQYAIRQILEIEGPIQNVSIILGNTVFLSGGLIDQSLELLEENSDIDSVMSVWEAQDDHPKRAMKLDNNGLLRSYTEEDGFTDTNRQSYEKAYFYDQGPWTVRSHVALTPKKEAKGPAAWWWMGERVMPMHRRWITGRDLHTELDGWIAEKWIRDQLKMT